MPADKISLDNAKKDKLFYFVANVVVFRDIDKRCLVLKRDGREKVHPNKWAVLGGKLEWKDMEIGKQTRMNGEVIDFENSVEELLVRECMEEAGIEIERDLKYINSVSFIRADGIPVVLLKFAAKYKSGEVKLEKGAFTDYKWVNSEEVKSYDCILGIKEEVEKTIGLFS